MALSSPPVVSEEHGVVSNHGANVALVTSYQTTPS